MIMSSFLKIRFYDYYDFIIIFFLMGKAIQYASCFSTYNVIIIRLLLLLPTADPVY